MNITNQEEKLFKISDYHIFWCQYLYNKSVPEFMINSITQGYNQYHDQFIELINSIVVNEELYQVVKLCEYMYGRGCVPSGITNKLDPEVLNNTSIDNFRFYQHIKSFRIENIEPWLQELKQTTAFDLYFTLKFTYTEDYELFEQLISKDDELVVLLKKISSIIRPDR